MESIIRGCLNALFFSFEIIALAQFCIIALIYVDQYASGRCLLTFGTFLRLHTGGTAHYLWVIPWDQMSALISVSLSLLVSLQIIVAAKLGHDKTLPKTPCYCRHMFERAPFKMSEKAKISEIRDIHNNRHPREWRNTVTFVQ